MEKKKKTRILPSSREKKRYLVFEVKSKDKFTQFEPLYEAIYQRTFRFLGELGMSKANIYILKDKWDGELQKGIIRVHYKHAQELRAALTLVKEADGREVSIRTLGMSGILKKAYEKYMGKRK